MAYLKKWEFIDKETDRLKVLGGWIVRSWNRDSVHQIFISDEYHDWKFDETS